MYLFNPPPHPPLSYVLPLCPSVKHSLRSTPTAFLMFQTPSSNRLSLIGGGTVSTRTSKDIPVPRPYSTQMKGGFSGTVFPR